MKARKFGVAAALLVVIAHPCHGACGRQARLELGLHCKLYRFGRRRPGRRPADGRGDQLHRHHVLRDDRLGSRLHA